MINLSKVLGLTFIAVSLLIAGASAHAQDTTTTTSESFEKPISPGGLFVEPILFGSREDTSIKTSQLPLISDNTTGRTEGYGIGVRLGVHASETIFVGADARYSKVHMSDSFYQNADADIYNYGPTVGIQTPVWGVRLIGTYIMGGEFNPGAGVRGLDLKFRDPTGFRYGAGIHLASVSINLEYQDLNYDKTDIQSWGSTNINSSNSVDTRSSGYLLSLSFPVEL